VDETFEQVVADDPVVNRLTTLPGIGPIPASAYVATLIDVTTTDHASAQRRPHVHRRDRLGGSPHEYGLAA
jgi:hypothetical protein